jgi:hypothetical protein
MKRRRLAAAVAVLSLLTHIPASAADDDATVLRVFLRDGTSLVSYGEFARVADRVIFSLPISAMPNPSLQLVNIPAARIDWDRTNRYAEAARAARYARTQAEPDYVALSNAVARTLNDVGVTADPAQRLAMVEGARKTLAEWPQTHFNYRIAEVRQLLSMLDETIADLRAAAGGSRFELSLVAVAPPREATERLLPDPTPVESVEQLLVAASLAESASERRSLLNVALADVQRRAASFPSGWAAATRLKVKRAIDADLKVDRSYQLMIRRAIGRADARARFADVRGISRVLQTLRQSDAVLGRRRPDAISDAVKAIEAKLDAARRLQLARDRWSVRAAVLRRYSVAMSLPLRILRSLDAPLDDIKLLVGSNAQTLALVQRQAARASKLISQIVPPDECREAHAMLISAVNLADNAATIRRTAAEAGDITRAWDASSAAAGALMLGAKARTDIQAVVARPQLQ